MGSRRTHEDRTARLREAGVDDAGLARVMGPIGLDIGARTPEETAVAICAEIIALRTGRDAPSLRDRDGPDPPGSGSGRPRGAGLSRSVGAVILAAGGGSRFAARPGAVHKLLAPWRGRPLVWSGGANARGLGLDPVWVVTGAVDLDREPPRRGNRAAEPQVGGGAGDLPTGRGAGGPRGRARRPRGRARRSASGGARRRGRRSPPLTRRSRWPPTRDGGAIPVRLAAAVWDLLPVTAETRAPGS